MPVTLPPPPIIEKPVTEAGYLSIALSTWLVVLYKALGSATVTGTAPAGASYITQSINADLTNEQSLGTLTSGLLKNTSAAAVGTLSTATQGTDYYAPGGTDVALVDGGTGASTATNARTNLGLGTLATQSGTFSGTSSGTNTGDQTITLTGNVTGSGTGSFAATIANDAVTYAKMQNVSATDKLLGRSSSGAGDVEEIVCTASGRALIDDATVSDQRTTLGLVIGTNVQAYNSYLTNAIAGTYSATYTAVANLDSTPSNTSCQYMRIGDIITVSGTVTIDPTTTLTSTQIGISLPVASDFASLGQCAGTAAASGITAQSAAILADVTNNRAQMQYICTDTTSQPMYFTFTYVVI